MPSRVIVLAPSWLGDAVMALPALAGVRRAYASGTLIIGARAPVASLFRLVPDVDEIVELAGKSGIASLSGRRGDTARLAAARGGIAVLFPNSFASAWVTWRARIPERWGYRTDWRRPLLTRAVPRPGGSRHLSEYYQALVAALGIDGGGPPARVAVGGEPLARARELLADEGWRPDTPLAGIAPGAAYGQAKRWPPERYAALIVRLAAELGATAVLVGSADDRPTGVEIERRLARDRVERIDRAAGRARWVNLIGRTDLPLVMAVMASCRAFVSNDTGAMHLAAAEGVGVTAIFGPTIEQETAPLPREAHTVLTHPVWCRPCMLRECPIDHRCMTGIGVDRVFEAVRRQLSRAGDSGQ